MRLCYYVPWYERMFTTSTFHDADDINELLEQLMFDNPRVIFFYTTETTDIF